MIAGGAGGSPRPQGPGGCAEPLRVGLVSDHFPPRAPGGAEWSIAALAELLAPRLERLVVAVAAGETAGREERGALAVVRFRAPLAPFSRRGALRPWALANPAFTLATALRLTRLARRERLDLLHAQSHAALPAAFLAARRLGLPVAATLRDTRSLCEPAVCLHTRPRVPSDCGYVRLMRRCAGEFLDRAGTARGARRRLRTYAEFSWLWLDNRLRWWCLRRCDAIVGPSREILDVYRARGLVDPRRSRQVAIPSLPPAPPPDAPARRAAARRSIGAGDGPLVLYLGKHSPGKGTAILRQAWDQVAPRFPEASLVLAGPGHPPAHRPGVRVAGEIPHERALDLILAADVVVSPSVGFEALPRSLVEAAGFGRPVIGTRSGGTPELIRDEENGLLVERGSVPHLAGALVRALGDTDLRARLVRGQEALRVGRLDRASLLDAHVDLYRALIEARRPAARAAAGAVRSSGAAP